MTIITDPALHPGASARLPMAAAVLWMSAVHDMLDRGTTVFSRADVDRLLPPRWRYAELPDGRLAWITVADAVAALVEQGLLADTDGDGWRPVVPRQGGRR